MLFLEVSVSIRVIATAAVNGKHHYDVASVNIEFALCMVFQYSEWKYEWNWMASVGDRFH